MVVNVRVIVDRYLPRRYIILYRREPSTKLLFAARNPLVPKEDGYAYRGGSIVSRRKRFRTEQRFDEVPRFTRSTDGFVNGNRTGPRGRVSPVAVQLSACNKCTHTRCRMCYAAWLWKNLCPFYTFFYANLLINIRIFTNFKNIYHVYINRGTSVKMP